MRKYFPYVLTAMMAIHFTYAVDNVDQTDASETHQSSLTLRTITAFKETDEKAASSLFQKVTGHNDYTERTKEGPVFFAQF